MQNNFSTEELLEQFKVLKQSNVLEDEFYKLYLESCSLLCKSYFSVIFEEVDKTKIKIQATYNNPSELFIEKSKELFTKASKRGFAFERYEGTDSSYKMPFLVVFKNYNTNSFVSLLLDKSNQSSFNEMLIRTQLVNDTPDAYFSKNKNEPTKKSLEEDFNVKSNDALEIFNILIHKDNFDLALLTLANEIAFRFDYSLVSIGWMGTSKITTKAISSIEKFEKNSDTVNLLEDLFEECNEQEETLIYPTNDSTLALYEVKKYYEHKKISHLVVIPIFYKAKVQGVLVCEKIEGDIKSSEIDSLKLIVNQISPWITTLKEKQDSIFKIVARKSINFIENSLSIKYTGLKLIATLFIITLISSLFIKIDYKIDGTTTVETDHISYISAPFDGMVDDIKVKEGDEVSQNDLLLTLDTNELKLKANENKSNVIRYSQESEKARATNSLADMKISLSKKEEAIVALKRINYYIEQSKIKAPYDGIVVEGDHTKLLGSPVNKGDVLLKIAKTGSMYLKIKVSEKDIDNIKDSGKFIFLTRPDKIYDIKVEKIIPVAKVDKNEGNIFVVKASIKEDQQQWWRPGMSGIAKLDGGEKTLFWIATHRLVDFIRIYLWW